MVVMEAHQQTFFGYPIIVAANDIILTLVGSAQVHPGQAGSTGKMETLAYVDGKPFVLVKAKWSNEGADGFSIEVTDGTQYWEAHGTNSFNIERKS